jgi:3-hydroxyisobutyrate dehydrogenase-like beta-hydroxyacid dehydrogenase
MGSGMASNYLKAGYQVNIWNRSPEKTRQLQEFGAKLLASPKLVAEASDIVFEVTANDESSRSVWQGDDGILTGANGDKTLVASATLSADWTDQLNGLCIDQGLVFFDMPLTGGRVAAESGTLTLLVGGNQDKLESLKSDLTAISSKLFYFGKAGSGMRYKLILNGLQAAHLAAFGEAMRLASRQGLDTELVGPALCDRPGGIVTEISWKAYRQARPPLTFSVDWITKDLEYAQKMAGGTELPILQDVLAKYHETQQKGRGSDDWTAINS